jgi:hypothetical protein
MEERAGGDGKDSATISSSYSFPVHCDTGHFYNDVTPAEIKQGSQEDSIWMLAINHL